MIIQCLECLIMCFKYFLTGNYDNIFYLLVLSLITVIDTSVYCFFYKELLKIAEKKFFIKILGIVIFVLIVIYFSIVLTKVIKDKSSDSTGNINCNDGLFVYIAVNALIISIFLLILTYIISVKFKAITIIMNYDNKKMQKLW